MNSLYLTSDHLNRLDIDSVGVHMKWFDLHLQVLYAKAIYYDLVRHGFQPISDERYDRIEQEYKEYSNLLELQPTASELVGWSKNPLLEAMAMRHYNKDLYERLKGVLFELRGIV